MKFIPALIERMANGVHARGPYHVSEEARELHSRLLVTDLHADSLMLGRDLLKRGTTGHVDLPRMIEGNAALQAFTVVTRTPATSSINNTANVADAMTALAVLSGWPREAVDSLLERALFQARRFRNTVDRSTGALTALYTADDLRDFLRRRETNKEITAGFLGAEGAHPLEGDLANLDILYDAGFRMIGLTHFFDNDVAGSQQGTKKYGLTDLGRELIARMEEKKMILDLAHASEKSIFDSLETATRPPLVSHTGVRGTCDNNRNLADETIKAIADAGGVIGIGYWSKMCGGKTAADIARSIHHLVNVGGIQCAALGSDFDGFIHSPMDISGMALMTEALMDEGFTEDEIRTIMGENTVRLLLELLP